MDDRIVRLESVVTILREQVRDLELRLSAVEGARANALDRDGRPQFESSAGIALERAPVQQWLALAGRTLVVLGGAYLLRALTESHVFVAQTGVALGLLYGAPWLFLASRAGSRGAGLDALCHALATALIGYPLVWEATIRFGVLTPPQSAAVLGALTAAALLLAGVRRLHSLAWVVTFGGLGSALGLAVATRDWNSYTLFAIALGLGTLWLGHVREWGEVRWLAAGGANLMLLIATGRAAVTGNVLGPLALQFLMVGGYLGSCALRTIVWRRPVTVFDALQGAAVLFVAVGGSIFLLRSTAGALWIGLATLALAAAAYVVTFSFIRPRREYATFFFWAQIALALSLMGTAAALGGPAASIVYAAAAAALAGVARRRGSLTLALHAAVFAIAASTASGLLDVSTLALVRPPAMWGGMTPAALIAFAALAFAALTPVHSPVESWTAAARVPRLMLFCALLWTSLGLAVLLVASGVANPRAIDPSVLATLRTGLLVAGTLALARAAHYGSGREAGWLMYPLLVITGIKLVFFDFPIGRPQTLFAAMALYGFALIVAPRLWRTAAGSVPAGQQSERAKMPAPASLGGPAPPRPEEPWRPASLPTSSSASWPPP